MKRLFSTILFLFLATLLFSTLTIHYLDVGQKETLYFIQTPYGENILIDAGVWNHGSVVSRYLRDQGIEVLNYVIATHPHQTNLDTLARNGVQILRTDLNGTIVIQTDGETFTVSAEKRAQVPTPQPESETEAIEYIGNINTKVFHVPTCSFLPAKHNRTFFSSREESVKAGYRPCGRCNP